MKRLKKQTKDKLLHSLFELGILLKFLNGILEIIFGIILFFISGETIHRFIKFIFASEIRYDPQDLLVNYLINNSQNLTHSVLVFTGIYLLIHGIIKVSLIIALWEKKLWAYPTAAVILFILTIYQIYLFIHLHSIFQFFLTILDILILLLLKFEYERIKNSKE